MRASVSQVTTQDCSHDLVSGQVKVPLSALTASSASSHFHEIGEREEKNLPDIQRWAFNKKISKYFLKREKKSGLLQHLHKKLIPLQLKIITVIILKSNSKENIFKNKNKNIWEQASVLCSIYHRARQLNQSVLSNYY